jgi:hypothetical protein
MDRVSVNIHMRVSEVIGYSYWHGSDVSGLDKLKPRYSTLVRRKVVFAAIYPEVAVAMTGHWSDSDFDFGRVVDRDTDDADEVPYVLRELRKDAFERYFSSPVSLYEVDHKGFHSYKTIQDFEVIAEHVIPILNEDRIDDPLKYLKDAKMVRLKHYR